MGGAEGPPAFRRGEPEPGVVPGSLAGGDAQGRPRMGSAARPRRSSGAVRWQALVAALMALAGAVLVAVVYLRRPPVREVPRPEVPSVNVEVEVVKALARMPDQFELPAVVEPNRVVHVSAEVEARVERIACEEGRSCQAGDLLVTLNTDLLQAEFDRAEAQARYDQSRYDRISNLFEEGASTKEELDQAAGARARSAAVMELARAQLERATILVPISGVLNRVLVEEGEYVQVGAPVVEIVDIDTAKVVVDVPERDVQFLSIGREVEVLVNPRGRKGTLAGTITYISELAHEGTRATRLEISVDNRRRLLRSGQIVRARLTRRVLTDVVMIPLAAVIPLEDGKVVYTVEGEEAQRREVEIGLIKGRRVRVLEGLVAGDRLIVAGHRFVGPGQSVTVVAEH